MSVKTELFGMTQDGQKITAYTVDNGHMSFRVLDYGAILVNVNVPDAKGNLADIVLGYDNAEQYFVNGCYFGSTIGPSANRIADGAFSIDGTSYQMPKNEGVNNLHTDALQGLHKKLFQAICGEEFVTFNIRLEDGECGLPGTRYITVTYSITVDNGIKIHYHATSDKKTILNLTNHSYFNLDGHGAGEIGQTLLTMNCSRYTPVVAGGIPTGEIAETAGTPMDFTTEQPIGDRIDADFEQLKLTGGYDHNYCVDGWTGDGMLRPVAQARSLKSGRRMEVYSTLPGVQFYAGNFIVSENGKSGIVYGKRGGFCLETQFYPDCIHNPSWPQAVFGEDTVYDSTTKYVFLT